MEPSRSQFVFGVLALLSLALARPALAGTPLPDPPFSGGGFVAPSTVVLGQEEHVNKLLNTYLHKRIACDRIAVGLLQLAYTPINAQKVIAVQDKWIACVQKVDAYYVKLRDRLLVKGTPACLDQAGIDAQRGAVDGLIAVIAAAVYCDPDGAAPDPVTGLSIPDKKQETIGEREVAKIVEKAGISTSKCYSKAARLALDTGGTFTPEIAAKLAACFTKVSGKAQELIADLDQTQKLPACLPVAAAEATVGAATAFAGASTAAIYCASPSGAFVDGLAGM